MCTQMVYDEPEGHPCAEGQVFIYSFISPFQTVPEILFEKKQLIPALQELLIAFHR